MAGFEIVKNKSQNDILKYIQPVAVYIMLLAVFATYTSIFDPGENMMLGNYGLWLIFSVGASYFLLKIKLNKKHIIRTVIVVAIVSLVMHKVLYAIFASFFTKLNMGFADFIEGFFELYGEYYNTTFSYEELLADKTGNEIVLAIFVLQLMLSTILILILKKRKGLFVAVLISVVPIVLAAYVGHIPKVASMWGLMIAMMLFVTVYKYTGDTIPKEELIKLAKVFMILFVGSTILTPVIENHWANNAEKYKDTRKMIREIQKIDFGSLLEKKVIKSEKKNRHVNYSSGGVGKGSFEGLSSFQPKGTLEMEVVLEEAPKEDIYLRAYTGYKYTNDGWDEMSADVYLQSIGITRKGADNNRILSQPYNRVYLGNSDISYRNMKINIKNASKDFGYAPYYANIPFAYTVIMDGYVDGEGKESREYLYYPRQQVETIDIYDLEEYDELWMRYQSYVSSYYNTAPSELKKIWQTVLEMEDNSIEEFSEQINQYFREEFSYSVAPGECPEGKDFVEYFMYENKEGFCVHFASAATLMYRMKGYNARYVEGYFVDSDKFVRQEDGTYVARVTDSMAHAWCETFDYELGWQPREHTLGYVGGSGISASQSGADNEETTQNTQSSNDLQNEQESETLEKETTSANIQENATEKKEGTGISGYVGEKGEGSVGKYNGKIVVLMAIFLFVISMFQRKIRRKLKINKFRTLTDNKGIINMYREIYDICIYCGMKKSDRSDRDIMTEVKADFTQLRPEEWDWMYECVERAAYTPHKVRGKENQQMYKLYQKFRYKVVSDMNLFKKFWFLYVLAK